MPEIELGGTEDPYGLLYEPEPFCHHTRAQGYGFVYFIGPESGRGPIKIGWAYNVPGRMGELQVGNPNTLVIYVAIMAKRHRERELHEKFAENRVRGEWFALSDALVAEIQRLRTMQTLFPPPGRKARHDLSCLVMERGPKDRPLKP